MNKEQYKNKYEESIRDPRAFWGEQSKIVSWSSPWKEVCSGDFENQDVRWFVQGKLNACYNCVDRHVENHPEKPAILWEGDSPEESRALSYANLHKQVCQFANVLKKLGVKKGDRVAIYLPMIPEIIIAMLACARIGAIHSVVFGGFSAKALQTRLQDLECTLLITADESIRGGKITPFKVQADQALKESPSVKKVIVIQRSGKSIPWQPNRDHWFHELMQAAKEECAIEHMDAEDPLFILYTSGSTGKPKGIVHSTGGYLVYVALTFLTIFDYKKEDIYWCTADLGWITGHSYLAYGPLANGATILLYEGTPNYPSAARYWEIIDKYRVSIFYTAPTAIRALRHAGDKWLKNTQRDSLRLLGTVGEPINPEVWQWYYEVVGKGQCPIVDTWWQTETGGILISPIPGVEPQKAGSATRPFFGIEPDIVDEDGVALAANVSGQLIIKKPWPGCMKTIYKDRQRFIDTYFTKFPGKYLTGDSAYRDEQGDFWIIGRNDDIIKIAGHRIGTGEVEGALVANHEVSEAAVIGIPDPIKGQAIYAFVVTQQNTALSTELKNKLIAGVRESIGPIATIAQIQWVKELPKTRSGKIMRRILQKIATGDYADLGDTSTLANPEVVEQLISESK